MTIGKKLLLCFGGLTVIAAGLGSTGTYSIRRLTAELNEYADVTVPKVRLFGDLKESFMEARLAVRSCMYFALLKRKNDFSAHRRRFEVSIGRAGASLEQMRPLMMTGNGKALIATLSRGIDDYRAAAQENLALLEAGKLDEARVLTTNKVTPTGERVIAAVEGFLRAQSEDVTAVSQRSATAASRALWTSVVFLILFGAVGIVVVWVVFRLKELLRSIVSRLSEGAGQVASAASQVSAGSQLLAQGASEQAASLEETSASSEEINSMARRNRETTDTASREMMEASQIVSDAVRRLEEMMAAMADISASSTEVSNIIRVINEIAFQTNVLALNAAVEAARAGAAGTGFAVVAEEVRSLAQRSAKAAEETAALIETSINKTKTGSRNLDLVAEGIHSIIARTARVKALVEEVNLGSREQTKGIEQVVKAIAQMEQVTQAAAASAEQSAAAAEELTQQSVAMNSLVNRLREMAGQ